MDRHVLHSSHRPFLSTCSCSLATKPVRTKFGGIGRHYLSTSLLKFYTKMLLMVINTSVILLQAHWGRFLSSSCSITQFLWMKMFCFVFCSLFFSTAGTTEANLQTVFTIILQVAKAKVFTMCFCVFAYIQVKFMAARTREQVSITFLQTSLWK